MRSEIILKIRNALFEVLNLSQDTEILPTSKLKDNLGLDSMSSLTFLVTLEENIEGFVVNPDTLQMSDLETVETITRYVLKEMILGTHIDDLEINYDGLKKVANA